LVLTLTELFRSRVGKDFPCHFFRAPLAMAIETIVSNRSEPESPSIEKMNVVHAETGVNYNGLKPEDADFLAHFSEADRKRVVRKIDVS
jgi:hypothetical protein